MVPFRKHQEQHLQLYLISWLHKDQFHLQYPNRTWEGVVYLEVGDVISIINSNNPAIHDTIQINSRGPSQSCTSGQINQFDGQYIDGNLIVTGTIAGTAIISNTIDTLQLKADAVTANELKVSTNQSGTVGIYVDGDNKVIEIHDGTRIRVKLGNLN